MNDDVISRQAAIDAADMADYPGLSIEDVDKVTGEVVKALKELPSAQPYTEEQIQTMQDLESAEIEKAYELGRESAQPQWIPCSERLPEEYGEYRITWTTSASKNRLIGDAEYEVTGEWDEVNKRFKGEWLLDEYIKNYPNVKVLAWKPLEEPWKGEQP